MGEHSVLCLHEVGSFPARAGSAIVNRVALL